MNSRGVERLLWGIAVVAAVAGAVGVVRDQSIAQAVQGAPIAAATPRPNGFDAQLLAKAASTIASSNPFRLERQPAHVAYGAEPPAEAMPSSLPPDQPMLSVTGIIGGNHWEAIVEGIPGQDGGLLVRAGQVIGDLRIRAINADTVIVTGPDTTWILMLKQPWN